MKTTFTVTMSRAELAKVLGLAPFPADYELSVVISDATATPLLAPVLVAATTLIGKTVEGIEITHYGYPGDSSPDSNSMKGIGDRGNHLTPNLSVALTETARNKIFGVSKPSTGKGFTLGGFSFQDDDQAPETNLRVDVYDPFYTGVDAGCTPEMFAKSKAEMVAAGILLA